MAPIPIKPRKFSSAGYTPTTSDLQVDEDGFNIPDLKWYSRDGSTIRHIVTRGDQGIQGVQGPPGNTHIPPGHGGA